MLIVDNLVGLSEQSKSVAQFNMRSVSSYCGDAPFGVGLECRCLAEMLGERLILRIFVHLGCCGEVCWVKIWFILYFSGQLYFSVIFMNLWPSLRLSLRP